jgi:hypothetical protein
MLLVAALSITLMPPTSAQESPPEFEPKSFWFIGTSNYHIRLEESEAQIDGLLNNTIGKLLPRWQEPVTFKDWSDEWRIWDLWVGYGRDLGPKSAWSVYAGGGVGTIINREKYLPLESLILDADFTRKSLLIGSSLSYYPWGRPEYRGAGIRNAFRGLRPVSEINVGYTNQTTIAEVRARLPLVGNALRVRMEDHYHLFWASPRFGVEIPLSHSDSLNILVGYLFFTDHAPEYNGFMLEIFYRHRF